MKSILRWIPVFVGLAVPINLVGAGRARARPAEGAASPSSGGPRFSKVLIVVLENADLGEALRQPEMAALAAKGVLLGGFHAETHPSQPNYIALVSGALHGVHDNSRVDLDGPQIGDLLDAKGRPWKAYLEGYPGGCFTGDRSGNYVRKHNPFISFSSLRGSPDRCEKHLVPAEQLLRDIRSDELPAFSVYIPDLKNDGHDTGVSYASKWLGHGFLPALGDPLPRGLLLVVTFDEGKSSKDNLIYTVLYGAGVPAGARSDASYDHYSLLRTIEDRFGLGTLGLNDAKAHAITGVWR